MKKSTAEHETRFNSARQEMIDAVSKGKAMDERLTIMIGVFQDQASRVNDAVKSGEVDAEDTSYIHSNLFKHTKELVKLVMTGKV